MKHLSEVEDAKLLLNTLGAINDRLVAHLGRGDLLWDMKSLDAAYLRKDLLWLLERGGQESGKTGCAAVEERLYSFTLTQGGMVIHNADYSGASE